MFQNDPEIGNSHLQNHLEEIYKVFALFLHTLLLSFLLALHTNLLAAFRVQMVVLEPLIFSLIVVCFLMTTLIRRGLVF